MTSALLLPNRRPVMDASLVDAPDVQGIPVTRHVQRLDGQISFAKKSFAKKSFAEISFAEKSFACGRYADIYLGILRDGLIDPAGKTISNGDIAVGTAHVYSIPSPDSRTTSCIKVVVKVFRVVHYEAQTPVTLVTEQKYSEASQ